MGLLGRKREEKSWDDLSPVTLDMLAVEPERFNDTQVRLEGLVVRKSVNFGSSGDHILLVGQDGCKAMMAVFSDEYSENFIFALSEIGDRINVSGKYLPLGFSTYRQTLIYARKIRNLSLEERGFVP